MNRINVQVVIPKAMENCINLLPLKIRKQYQYTIFLFPINYMRFIIN